MTEDALAMIAAARASLATPRPDPATLPPPKADPPPLGRKSTVGQPPPPTPPTAASQAWVRAQIQHRADFFAAGTAAAFSILARAIGDRFAELEKRIAALEAAGDAKETESHALRVVGGARHEDA